MTTPTRIATFLFQSALCLGLAAGPVFAGQREVNTQSDSHALTRERGGAEHASTAQSAAEPKEVSTSHAAQTQSKAHAKPATQAVPGSRTTR